ncbi:MAG: cell envelope integrity protein CreD [Treponema sp.]|nr:cell envelope integrity protein CreD [Treponema sp.]
MSDQKPVFEKALLDSQINKQKNKNNFITSGGFKIGILAVLILLLLIPITMIRFLISERSQRATEAEESIMEAWGSQFVLSGPVIRIPVTEIEEIVTTTDKGEKKIESVQRKKALWITPKDVAIQMDFSAERKHRGIFSVALFSGDVSITGSFSYERVKDQLNVNQEIFPGQAEIIIGLTSQKGIRRIIKADWNGDALFFKPGNQNFSTEYSNNSGMNASSPFNTEGLNSFDIQFSVQGGKALRILPVGETTAARICSDWPSPSYQGGFLPSKHEFSQNGFDAEWEISYLSRSIPLFWISGEKGEYENRNNLSQELFGVDFFKPLDHYSLSERAVKYAILFIIIPFLTLFFLEIFSQKSIHPAQYLLSGFANVIFYLLLLSISEHMSFSLAYLISSFALTAMMTFYAHSLLEKWASSAYMGLIMAMLYLILYITLNAEDWALLIGSIAAFVICGVVMFLTRKLDWKKLKVIS